MQGLNSFRNYLVENRLVDEPILLFYINDPSIIVGRNQNIEEVDQAYVEEKEFGGSPYVGGGAVYHDRNFSFCFIKDDDGSSGISLASQPVIEALHKMGAKRRSSKGVMICWLMTVFR